MSKASISVKDQRLLHVKSGNRCAIDKNHVLVEIATTPDTCVGENAHIYGEKPTAARYDATQPESFVNSEKNLIFACASCHKRIDDNPLIYTVEKLFKIKAGHEAWVIEQLTTEGAKVGYSELDVLMKYLIGNSMMLSATPDYTLTAIAAKITKNSLDEISSFIQIGTTNSNQVRDFLSRNPDMNFGSRLNAIVVSKYNEYKATGITATEIFWKLVKDCYGGGEYKMLAAAITIIVYFFEECEVFEK